MTYNHIVQNTGIRMFYRITYLPVSGEHETYLIRGDESAFMQYAFVCRDCLHLGDRATLCTYSGRDTLSTYVRT